MARALAANGACVVIADVQDEAGEKVADSLKGEGHGFVHLDVTDEASWENAVVAAAQDFGGLDVLVNNAGVEISSLITEIDPQDVRTMLEVNVLGTSLGLKWGLRMMRPDGLAGRGRQHHQRLLGGGDDRLPGHPDLLRDQVRGRPAHPGGRDGGPGKLGYGVRVNCIYPGLVPTAMGQGLAVTWPSSASSVRRPRPSRRSSG